MAAPTSSLVGRDTVSGLITGERLLDDVDLMIADAVGFGRSLSVAVLALSAAGLPPTAADVAHVADVIRAGSRAGDLPGQLDDETFLLVLPGTAAAAAVSPLARLQREVSGLPPAAAGPLAVSVGVAALHGLMSVEELIVQAISLAEQAVGQGPGRLCLGPEPVGCSARLAQLS